MSVPVRYLQVMNCQSQYPTDQAFHMRWYQRHWCVVSMLLPVRHKSASAYSHQIELADVVVSAALVCCKRVVANDTLTIYRLSTLAISLIKPSTYGGVSGIGKWSTPWCRRDTCSHRLSSRQIMLAHVVVSAALVCGRHGSAGETLMLCIWRGGAGHVYRLIPV
jgi:hypothetical protein